jgi:hypothetical protein
MAQEKNKISSYEVSEKIISTEKEHKAIEATTAAEVKMQPVIIVETPKIESEPDLIKPKPEIILDKVEESTKRAAHYLGGIISQHRNPMQKAEIESILRQAKQQILAVYTQTGYYLEAYHMGKVVCRIPAKGEFYLAKW